jgi:putative transposase
MKTIAHTLGVSRSNLYEQTSAASGPRRRPLKPQDAALMRRLRLHVDERPTYGYRRITALLRR